MKNNGKLPRAVPHMEAAI